MFEVTEKVKTEAIEKVHRGSGNGSAHCFEGTEKVKTDLFQCPLFYRNASLEN
jgi:hypothetical protein